MDPDTYQKIFRYLSNGSYPQGATKTEKYTVRRRASVYILDEGALYYKKGKRQVVYDKEEAKQIFYEYHVSAANAHCGIVKTRYAVCKRFYWPGITTDIDKWVGECMECRSVITVKLTDSIPIEAGECTVSQTSGFTIKEETDPTPLQAGEWTVSQTSVSTVKDETDPASLKTEECIESEMTVFTIKEETEEEIEMNPTPSHASQPFEFVGMYLIGKVAKTSTGNMYICVMVDYHTRWSEAFALPSKTAVNVAGCVKKFFFRFGAPKRIFIDQRQEFVNKLNKKLCKSLGGQHRLCARYYPQTNELFETLNETVQRALSELVSQRPASWDMYLDAMMFVLRTKKHITTEFSPFFLLFGMEARHPSEIP